VTDIYALAALWIGLALAAALLAIRLRIANALSEIVVGVLAGAFLGTALLGVDETWIRFLAGAGAIVLTFLAGAELDPDAFRRQWKEATAIGLISFFAPFIGCAAGAYWLLGWGERASLLAGIAMSTTSVAVVYAVMLEFGFNRTDYGKMVLAACFITDLGTVVGLGLIFAPFTVKTVGFVAGLAAGLAGALFAFSKGSISPESLSVSRSVDALVMVLLGGLHTLTGPVWGAALLTWLDDTLARSIEYWRAAIGVLILALVTAFPQGIGGFVRERLAR